MSESRSPFTPGPWIYREAKDAKTPISADVQGPHGSFIADCGSHETADANARLIAAAPELLDAAKEVLRQLDSPESVALGDCDRLEAAIAKAEGR